MQMFYNVADEDMGHNDSLYLNKRNKDSRINNENSNFVLALFDKVHIIV